MGNDRDRGHLFCFCKPFGNICSFPAEGEERQPKGQCGLALWLEHCLEQLGGPYSNSYFNTDSLCNLGWSHLAGLRLCYSSCNNIYITGEFRRLIPLMCVERFDNPRWPGPEAGSPARLPPAPLPPAARPAREAGGCASSAAAQPGDRHRPRRPPSRKRRPPASGASQSRLPGGAAPPSPPALLQKVCFFSA